MTAPTTMENEMSKIVHAEEYEWGSLTISESAMGHILTTRSQVSGNQDNARVMVPFSPDFPRGVDFGAAWNECISYADYFGQFAWEMPGAKVLQHGHIVF